MRRCCERREQSRIVSVGGAVGGGGAKLGDGAMDAFFQRLSRSEFRDVTLLCAMFAGLAGLSVVAGLGLAEWIKAWVPVIGEFLLR
jgi:hypothetical protein